MPSLKAGELVACLQEDGWAWCSVAGRHQQQDHLSMCHPTKSGKVSIPHGVKEYGRRSKLLRTILRQAQLSNDDLTAIFFKLYR